MRMAFRCTILATLAISISCHPNDGCAQNKRDPQPVPQPPVTIVDNSTRQTQTDAPTQKTPESHAGIEWVQWALVLIGAFSFFAVWKQARESSKATKAMRDSVLLQQKELQLTVNKERPYLTIEVVATAANEYQFLAKNAGKSPARIASVWHRPLTSKRGEKPQVPTQKESGESLISHLPRLLPPESLFVVASLDATARSPMRVPVTFMLFLYGRIRYFNTLEMEQREPYETEFLYWVPVHEGHPPLPYFDGPEYNRWT